MNFELKLYDLTNSTLLYIFNNGFVLKGFVSIVCTGNACNGLVFS